jgi:hypothetical protein
VGWCSTRPITPGTTTIRAPEAPQDAGTPMAKFLRTGIRRWRSSAGAAQPATGSSPHAEDGGGATPARCRTRQRQPRSEIGRHRTRSRPLARQSTRSVQRQGRGRGGGGGWAGAGEGRGLREVPQHQLPANLVRPQEYMWAMTNFTTVGSRHWVVVVGHMPRAASVAATTASSSTLVCKGKAGGEGRECEVRR